MSDVVSFHPKDLKNKDLGDRKNKIKPHKFVSRNFAFVSPRFGADVGGGAETLVREIALRLAKRGDSVTILTTCAKDNRTWENDLLPGDSIDNGVIVKRFQVDPRDLDVWIPHQINIHEGINPGLDAQLEWLGHSVNSSDLYDHIMKFNDQYDALFFAPYLFGTTFWGSLINPEKSILIPCLHDENYAYLESISAMFRSVKGCIFNAEPEKDLANQLFGYISGGSVGMGFTPFDEEYVLSLEPYLNEGTEYIIYVGRKETGKNAHVLIDNFLAGKESGHIPKDLKLVFLGGGSFADLYRPTALERDDIVDIGFLTEREKHQLIKHAKFLCQPSRNESFSIVLMEAWLLGIPVVVDSQCSVTRYHVTESNGGLYYESPQEFAEVAKVLLEDNDLCLNLSKMGYQYVVNEYSWQNVLTRFDAILDNILNEPK